jgi:leader peptidase (prepilin peptidase) / N-methyltransferase
MFAAPGWLMGTAATLAAAVVLAALPQRLLAEVSERPRTWRDALRLGLAVAAAGLVAVAAAPALGGEAWRWGVLAACLCALTIVDARFLVIPDLYVLALLALAIGWVGWAPALAGAALGGGLLFIVRLAFLRFRRVEALGLGDVKLMAALGALAGAEGVLWIILAASLIGVALVLGRGRSGDAASRLAPLGACAAAPALVVLAVTRLGP